MISVLLEFHNVTNMSTSNTISYVYLFVVVGFGGVGGTDVIIHLFSRAEAFKNPSIVVHVYNSDLITRHFLQ